MKGGKTRTAALRTLLILVAFVVLLAYVLLTGGEQEPPVDPEATPTPWPMLSWQIEDLQEIQVTDGAQTYRLEREGEGWRFWSSADPDGAPADPRTVYFPLYNLAGLDARLGVMEEVSDPAIYGLDAPALTVTVQTSSGDEEQLYVGRQTPDGTAFYVQREGDSRLYVVEHYKFEYLFEWLSAPPDQATPTP